MVRISRGEKTPRGGSMNKNVYGATNSLATFWNGTHNNISSFTSFIVKETG